MLQFKYHCPEPMAAGFFLTKDRESDIITSKNNYRCTDTGGIIMKEKCTIYHGSEKIIQKPVFGFGNKYNDYGLGFYCISAKIKLSQLREKR